MERLGDSRYVLELKRLHAAQQAARTPDEREAADHDLAHLFRMNAAGRLDEYFGSREPGDEVDADV